MAASVETELVQLERKYWQALKDRDVEGALALTDDPSLVTDAQGVGMIGRKAFEGRMKNPTWTLSAFELSDEQVRLLTDDVAILAYRVHEELTVDGKPITLDAADASTWVRRDGRWVCALHTESLAGDPFGRDRRPRETRRQRSTPPQDAADRARITTPTERTIHIERIFRAPRERVWQAMTDPKLVARWWGRGNPLDVERLEPKKGGHWRFVERGPEGPQGFEGRFREVNPPEHIVQTFEWDGMPGYVAVDDARLEELDGQTRLVVDSLFSTTEERDGMLDSGMETGLNQSYAALDTVLATLH